jgi:hypothetical protein
MTDPDNGAVPPVTPPATPVTPPPATPVTPPPPASAYTTPPPAYGAAGTVGPKTNTLAIVAIILGFLVPIGGIITGHIALGQIKKTGEAGRGLALTGTIVGYVLTVFYVLAIILSILIPILVFGTAGQYYRS